MHSSYSPFFLDAIKIETFEGCTISKGNNLLSIFSLGECKEPGTVPDKTSKFIGESPLQR